MKVHDFASSVQPFYERNKWEWDYDGHKAIPSADDISETLKDLIKQVKIDFIPHSSGGLFAQWDDEAKAVEYGLIVSDKEISED
jgi:hypothetical protein